jgi:hypothetical protein
MRKKRTRKGNESFRVRLPWGSEGETTAFSYRQAVSYFVSREYGPSQVARIMNILDEEYGGAEYYAFSSVDPKIPVPEPVQDEGDLRKSTRRLTLDDNKLFRECAFAYDLGKTEGVDFSENPELMTVFLDRARTYLNRRVNPQ